MYSKNIAESFFVAGKRPYTSIRHGKVTEKRKRKKTFCLRELNIYLNKKNSNES